MSLTTFSTGTTAFASEVQGNFEHIFAGDLLTSGGMGNAATSWRNVYADTITFEDDLANPVSGGDPNINNITRRRLITRYESPASTSSVFISLGKTALFGYRSLEITGIVEVNSAVMQKTAQSYITIESAWSSGSTDYGAQWLVRQGTGPLTSSQSTRSGLFAVFVSGSATAFLHFKTLLNIESGKTKTAHTQGYGFNAVAGNSYFEANLTWNGSADVEQLYFTTIDGTSSLIIPAKYYLNIETVK